MIYKIIVFILILLFIPVCSKTQRNVEEQTEIVQEFLKIGKWNIKIRGPLLHYNIKKSSCYMQLSEDKTHMRFSSVDPDSYSIEVWFVEE